MKSRAFTYLARMILLLFVIANTGFTTVIRTCSMEDTGCCGGEPADMLCDMETPFLNQVILIAATDCTTSAALGGLANTHAIEVKTPNKTKRLAPCFMYAPHLLSLNIFHGNTDIETNPTQHASGQRNAGQKYIFNLSLLI